ncbi:hypothetical protein IAT38_006775 [Cryptococcus sp. DSM 104549]
MLLPAAEIITNPTRPVTPGAAPLARPSHQNLLESDTTTDFHPFSRPPTLVQILAYNQTPVQLHRRNSRNAPTSITPRPGCSTVVPPPHPPSRHTIYILDPAAWGLSPQDPDTEQEDVPATPVTPPAVLARQARGARGGCQIGAGGGGGCASELVKDPMSPRALTQEVLSSWTEKGWGQGVARGVVDKAQLSTWLAQKNPSQKLHPRPPLLSSEHVANATSAFHSPVKRGSHIGPSLNEYRSALTSRAHVPPEAQGPPQVVTPEELSRWKARVHASVEAHSHRDLLADFVRTNLHTQAEWELASSCERPTDLLISLTMAPDPGEALRRLIKDEEETRGWARVAARGVGQAGWWDDEEVEVKKEGDEIIGRQMGHGWGHETVVKREVGEEEWGWVGRELVGRKEAEAGADGAGREGEDPFER